MSATNTGTGELTPQETFFDTVCNWVRARDVVEALAGLSPEEQEAARKSVEAQRVGTVVLALGEVLISRGRGLVESHQALTSELAAVTEDLQLTRDILKGIVTSGVLQDIIVSGEEEPAQQPPELKFHPFSLRLLDTSTEVAARASRQQMRDFVFEHKAQGLVGASISTRAANFVASLATGDREKIRGRDAYEYIHFHEDKGVSFINPHMTAEDIEQMVSLGSQVGPATAKATMATLINFSASPAKPNNT